MDYTHYWYRVKSLPVAGWKLWLDDVTKILDNLPEHTTSAGGYYQDDPLTIWQEYDVPNSKPLLNRNQVCFNGAGNLGHETFYVTRVARDIANWCPADVPLTHFGFCKTARKPYDLVVTACLIRLAYRFHEGVRISSDGDAEDWEEGRQLCKRLFGYACVPFRDEAYEETA